MRPSLSLSSLSGWCFDDRNQSKSNDFSRMFGTGRAQLPSWPRFDYVDVFSTGISRLDDPHRRSSMGRLHSGVHHHTENFTTWSEHKPTWVLQ